MAIHPELPGLEVKVCVQGQPLQEYDDDKIPEPNTTTKYIEARSGKSFSIMTEFKTPFPAQYDVLARISIDGVMMDIKIRKRDELFQGWKVNTYRSYQGGECVKQKFTFAKLNISKPVVVIYLRFCAAEEADKAAPDVVALEQILSIKGCITLSLNFVEFIQDVVTDDTSYNDDRHQQLAALQEIPEKALKGDALSHQAVYVESG
ncbi:uncharacterized protein J4E79_008339 [Alternaria viburni]|uniref:uncharacterized protein n=1 Tax=Alternaria viburni TaxID=566460 RepID=UPI0020C43CB3|nr:uncharacterized protein J4E79_008339 [Alternaria viburni]KAI4655272.1 hypothetical protein J4E79_008339 [Alternaria viburni]